MRQAQKGELKRGGYRVRGRDASKEVSRFPTTILSLAPSYVTIAADGYLSIEMHGGMDHFGVRIYPEDFVEPHPGYKYGNRKLLDGIWYYDEEYNYDADYDKVIDQWLAKSKRQE